MKTKKEEEKKNDNFLFSSFLFPIEYNFLLKYCFLKLHVDEFYGTTTCIERLKRRRLGLDLKSIPNTFISKKKEKST